ncbi:MAG: hypothetical protein PHV36_04185 [Elusimicrobiales bacterium]|nr:hypothetical protein [Elusimicrobiales bacterium]
MRGSEDLKNLLEKLKGEVAPLPQRQPETPEPPAKRGERVPEPPSRQPRGFYAAGPDRVPQRAAPPPERTGRSYSLQERVPSAGPQNTAWGENKEIILFGMLASLIAALGGVLAGIEYLVVVGAVFFSFFSLALLLALFRFSLSQRGQSAEAAGLAERVDALSRKVEMLSAKAATEGLAPPSGSPARDTELENRVEELRVLVKSLTKAVGME